MCDRKHNHLVTRVMCCFLNVSSPRKKVSENVLQAWKPAQIQLVQLRPNTKPYFHSDTYSMLVWRAVHCTLLRLNLNTVVHNQHQRDKAPADRWIKSALELRVVAEPILLRLKANEVCIDTPRANECTFMIINVSKVLLKTLQRSKVIYTAGAGGRGLPAKFFMRSLLPRTLMNHPHTIQCERGCDVWVLTKNPRYKICFNVYTAARRSLNKKT